MGIGSVLLAGRRPGSGAQVRSTLVSGGTVAACPLDRGCLHPGLAGFRAERGDRQPHALDLRLDGRLVAFGANHRRPPADRRLDALAAWLLLHETWVRRGWRPAIVLGFWCGLGVYLDSMFVLTLAGLAFAGLIAVVVESFSGRSSARGELSGRNDDPGS